MTEDQEQTAALNAALAQAQCEFPAITKDKTVTVKTREHGTYSFSYAPLDSILAACRPVMAKNGLALVQLLENNGQGPALRTELRHKGGAVIGSSFPLPSVPSTPQQLGSVLTYIRRYAIVALLGIATEDDDDAGQAADAKPAAKPAKPKPPETPTTSPSRVLAISAIENALTELGAEPPNNAASWKDVADDRTRRKYGRGVGQLTDAEADELIQAMTEYQTTLELERLSEEIEF